MTRKRDLKSKKVRILTALVCDTARRENNGKEILVGIYGDDIVYPSLPAFSALTLWARIKFEELMPITVELRVSGDHGQQIAAPIKIELPPPKKLEAFSSLVVEGIPMQIQSAGSILFQWRPAESEWETMVALQVTVGQVPTVLPTIQITPTVSPPPSERSPTAAS